MHDSHSAKCMDTHTMTCVYIHVYYSISHFIFGNAHFTYIMSFWSSLTEPNMESWSMCQATSSTTAVCPVKMFLASRVLASLAAALISHKQIVWEWWGIRETYDSGLHIGFSRRRGKMVRVRLKGWQSVPEAPKLGGLGFPVIFLIGWEQFWTIPGGQN